MRRIIPFFTCFLLLMNTAPMLSAQELDWGQKAEQILQEVQREQYLEAKEDIKQLSDNFIASDLAKKQLKIEALQTLSTLLVELDTSLNAISPNKTNLVRKATQLYLAFDAASHRTQPRWKGYRATLEEDIARIEKILPTENRREIKRELDKLIEDYQLIRPAILVTKPVEATTKFDSLFVFLRDQTEYPAIREGLKEARQLVQIIFLGKDEDVLSWKGSFQKIPTGFILFVSGLISSALTYVSWRKYWERKSIP